MYDTSPFGDNMEIDTRQKQYASSKFKALASVETGEIVEGARVVFTKSIDRSHFIKLFCDNLKTLTNVKQASVFHVYFYMLSNLKINKGTVVFNIDECSEFSGVKGINTIYKALAILCELKFIARSKKTYVYYLNPNICFKGSRLSIV